MGLGVRTFFDIVADIPIASSIVPITTTLASPIAANQRQKLAWWVPFTLGATGGVRAIVVVPAGGTVFELTGILYNTVAPATTLFEQQASAAFTNALANAGDHWLQIWATIVNGATAGTVDLQMAQNTSDVLTLTISRGGTLDVISQ
ncbi:MAG: hypothetical protein V4721_12395 [Bacteroidota bacterium]